MKKFVIAFAVIFVCAGAASAELRNVDWIVAIVDNGIITYTKLIDEMRVAAARLGVSLTNIPPVQERRLAQQVLDNLITESILIQESKRRGVTATPAEIDKETNEAFARVHDQFATEQAFERALATEFITPDILRKRYATQSEAQILRRKLVDHEIRSKIRVSDSDVVAGYNGRAEEIRVRHILVSDPATAERVRERLVAGENFGVVSSSVSNLEAADLGWIQRGGVDLEFEVAAFALQPGDISPVTQSSFGYHVIEALDRRAVELPPLTDELKDEISNQIFSRRFEKIFREFVDDLKTKAYVEIREDFYRPIP